jgi:hypothetical protein
MKLRILGNSIRFRLGRSEVESFGQHGVLEETVRLGGSPANALKYSLKVVDGDLFTSEFVNGNAIVGIPRILAESWVSSDAVTISGRKILDEDSDLKILIEKDFVCLNAHNDEDQSDRYPHPKGPDAC